MTGYSISLATSVNRLTNDNNQIVRVMTFIEDKGNVSFIKLSRKVSVPLFSVVDTFRWG